MSVMDPMKPLHIKSKVHDYSVEPAANLREAVQKAAASAPQAYFLVDRAVLGLYADAFRGLDLDARVLALEATEEEKSYEAVARPVKWLLEKGFRRDALLVVVGGGVLQDIGCFIASVMFRGIRWELIPTTLLAQCDSCIGSKSSLNIGQYKNQLGTFYPPHRIHLVFDVLKTLPADELRSGMGEAIKLALIADEGKVTELREILASGPLNPEVLSRAVRLALEIKKTYIEQDEFDRGVRNLLNYGHTFGHAFESATSYQIPHGIAVVLGMMTATYVSERLGWVTPEYRKQVDGLLRPYFTPYEKILASADFERVLGAMKLDKKNAGGKIVCILTRGAGRMEKAPLDAETQLRPILRDCLESVFKGASS